MKILGINSSPRRSKSQTLRLVRSVLDGASDSGAEVELVDLCQLKIEYCNACQVCYAKGECVKKDDFQDLYQKILKSDGLILGSPNYLHSVTAQLKTLLDRMTDAIHCQLFSGKYGCAVATAGGPQHGEVTDYLTRIIIGFGASSVGSVGAMATPEEIAAGEKKAFSLGKELVEAIGSKKVYPDQEKAHQEACKFFQQLVMRNQEAWAHEYEYWSSLEGSEG
jgi:multimeric flavodoxin WrbA